MQNRYKHSSHVVHKLSFHIIWCPKYRRKVLVGEIENRLKELLIEKATEMGIEIKTMEVMPDHVHIFVSSDPTFAPHEIAGWLKGYTSFKLRRCHEIKCTINYIKTLYIRYLSLKIV